MQKVLLDLVRIRSMEKTTTQMSQKGATSATTVPAWSKMNRGILDELAERLGNFHDSALALADCLQTRNVTREADQSMIEAAKCMIHRLLGEASDDLERVTSQSREGLHIDTTRNAHRCSGSETPVGKSCSRPETLSCIVKLESALRNLTLFAFRKLMAGSSTS